MENDPQQRKPAKNYLQGLQSLPDNIFLRREHQVPKVTENPRLHIVRGDEGYEDNVVFLPKLPKDDPPDIPA